jgi:hypothetical protein
MERQGEDAHLLARIVVAAILLIAYFTYTKLGSGPVTGHFGGSGYIVENKKYRYDYAVSGGSTFGGVLIATGRQ